MRERNALLRSNLKASDTVQLSESFQIPAAQMLALVREHALEGVIAKRLSSCYEQGKRSGAWVKVRVELAQEFVIGGYTCGTHGFDAVLLGFYKDGALQFCASVRNGFVPASRRELFKRLEPLSTATCPFSSRPEKSPGRWGQGLTAAKMRDCVWLQPETIGQFRFLEWTPNDHLRHASFVGLREDKDPRSVVKEGAEHSPRRLIPPGDDLRDAERIAGLVTRYAERFDSPDRLNLYSDLANRLESLRGTEAAFVHADEPKKKQPQRERGRSNRKVRGASR